MEIKIKFTHRLGFICPTTYNPAEFYVKILAESEENKMVYDMIHDDERIIETTDIRLTPNGKKSSNANLYVKKENIKEILDFIRFILFI